MALQSDKLGDSTLQGNETPFMQKDLYDYPDLPVFDDNSRMIQAGRFPPLPTSTSQSNFAGTPSVIISNMEINGEKAPEDLRTDMQSYMDSVLGEVFGDAMRETVR